MAKPSFSSPKDQTIAFFRKLPPLIVTYQELRQKLLPITAGYKWGEGTILDLWKMGAPTPDSMIGSYSERRIVFPGQLATWLADVLERQGRPLDEAARTYIDLQKLSK